MRPSRHSNHRERSWKNKVLPPLVKIGVGMGGIAILVTGGIQMARLQAEEGRIARIASYFNCVCEMQCSLTWATCKCTKPGGASEGKNYIREALKEGLSDEEIIVLANQKYGGLNLLDKQ